MNESPSQQQSETERRERALIKVRTAIYDVDNNRTPMPNTIKLQRKALVDSFLELVGEPVTAEALEIARKAFYQAVAETTVNYQPAGLYTSVLEAVFLRLHEPQDTTPQINPEIDVLTSPRTTMSLNASLRGAVFVDHLGDPEV